MAVSLLALLLLGAALEFSRERREVPKVAETSGGSRLVQEALRDLDTPVIRETGVSIPLQAKTPFSLGARGRPLDGLISDDRPDSGVWSAESTASTTTLRRLAPDRGGLLRLPTPARPDAIDVAQFSSQIGLAAVLVNGRSDGSLHVDVWRVSGSARSLLGRYDTPAIPRAEGSQRTVLLGRWSGPKADLFVLDRASRNAVMEVRVLAGESDFRSTAFSIRLDRAKGFDRRLWAVDLQDLAGSGRSDIVFTSRGGTTGSGNIEVHALSGQTNFSRYLLQVPTSRPVASMAGHRALVIHARGQAEWLFVDVATGLAIAHPLLAVPGPPSTP